MIHGIILTDTLADYSMKPLGAYTIANILRQHGFNIIVINMYAKFEIVDLKRLLSKFISSETLFFGYSSTLFSTWDIKNNDYTWLLTDIDHFTEINEYVKTLNSTIKIIFGGSASQQFINHVKENHKNYSVDYAMHGYSEAMVVDFVSSLQEKRIPRFSGKTAGVYEIYYDLKGESHNFRNNIFNWNPSDYIIENESLPLEVARGCIFKCKFCAWPLLGKNKNDDSYIKQEDVLLNHFIKNYEHSKTLNYFIVDDTFNERTDKIEMLLRIRDKTKLNLSFTGYNRLDLIHRYPEQVQLLKDLNFNGMLFGIESLNYPSAKSIGKGLKPEFQIETLYKLKEVFKEKVSIVGLFIIGLPHETPDTFHKWADWVISKESPLDNINFTPLIIGQEKTTHAESEFYKNYGEFGYTLSDDKKSWYNNYWSFEDCGKLMFNYMDKIEKSGKQKIGPTTALGLTKFGFKFYDLINTSFNDFYDVKSNRLEQRKQLNKNISTKAQEFKNNYYNFLLNL